MIDFSKCINWDRVNNLSDEDVLAVAKALGIKTEKEEESEQRRTEE